METVKENKKSGLVFERKPMKRRDRERNRKNDEGCCTRKCLREREGAREMMGVLGRERERRQERRGRKKSEKREGGARREKRKRG